jgi:hypothetical protein
MSGLRIFSYHDSHPGTLNGFYHVLISIPHHSRILKDEISSICISAPQRHENVGEEKNGMLARKGSRLDDRKDFVGLVYANDRDEVNLGSGLGFFSVMMRGWRLWGYGFLFFHWTGFVL